MAETNSNREAFIKELPGVQTDAVLAPFTTYKIGGPADFLFEARNEKEIIASVKAAKKFGLPVFILGGGSNLLIPDEGCRGLVVRVKNAGIKTATSLENKKISVGAGTMLGDLTRFFLENSFSGMEWAAGIPGTVGGAIRGNAGAFGGCVSDVVETVTYFDLGESGAGFKKAAKNDCGFGYRDSVFKKRKDWLIVSGEINVHSGNQSEIKRKMDENIAQKISSQPLNYPSAGSVFKNPKDGFSAKMIEECGLKGKRIGNAMISDRHANFIVNLGGATEKEIKKLIALAKEEVFKKFGVSLEEEIEIVE